MGCRALRAGENSKACLGGSLQQTLYQALSPALSGASQQRRSHSPRPASDHCRPGTKPPSQLAAPRSHGSELGLRGPRGAFRGRLAQPGDGPSAGTPPPSARRHGPPPWGLSAECGWGTGSPSLSEMSATKDGIQRGLSRNKGQVLVWDEGWGWAGQMFTWNGLSGHPQATGAAGAWHGACLPTTTGHCKDSDPSQMGTHPKAPRGTASQGLGMVTPSQALPAVGERRSWAGWLSP